jgi:hypothetical protein
MAFFTKRWLDWKSSMRLKQVPSFSFVLEELEESRLAPRLRTRPIFGSLGIYIDEKIVFILRKKRDSKTLRDDGVWMAIMPEHNPSLRRDFPTSRPIELFQARGREGFSGWLNLPENEEGFEEAALRACRLVIDGDLRIGKIPKSRSLKRS